VAESSPNSPRRAVELSTVKSIVDQADDLGVEHIYFTGGEPFILDDIYSMLAYGAERLPTTVLTNAMLFNEIRLKRLISIRHENLTVQVSLDGSKPEQHDPYRGKGSWVKTIKGIHRLQENDFKVRISTTETTANSDHLDEICDFCRSLGISADDHIVRPLAKRGFSDQGVEVSKQSLFPEMTITAEAVFWHPLSTDPDLLVSSEIFPLSCALSRLRVEFEEIIQRDTKDLQEFQ
jgi:MoaA/NifB/PqqE/SkfB family radical SAM enzyme